MKILKKLLKFILIALLSTGIASLVIFTLHYIPVGEYSNGDHEVYLYDNGMHIDIVIPEGNRYMAYGWGSKIFFMDVPEWKDLTYTVGFKALFTEPASCMRVTEYFYKNPNWKTVKVTKDQFDLLKSKILDQFEQNEHGQRINIRDNFYEAKGSYFFLRTCNTWVNELFKDCGLKAKVFTLTSSSLSKLY
jgi:hypothetical protein